MNAVRMKLLWGLPCLLVTILGGVACGGGGGRPEVSAVVEGIDVRSSDTESLVDAYLQRHVSRPEQKPMPRPQISKLVLGYQIKLAFLEHTAATMGVSDEGAADLGEAADAVNPDAYGLIGERREDYVNELRAGRLSKAIAQKLYSDVAVSDADVREEYERRSPVLDRRWKATTKVARFTAQGPVDQLRPRVEKGESFEQAASALGAKAVATVEVNPLVAPLAAPVLDAIGQTPAGQMSKALPTDGEFLAVFVERRQELPRLTFDDLRPELTNTLVERQRYRMFQDWFDQQLAKAKIAVDGYYGKWNREATKVT
jgi:PPIC-type PPIASE domain